MSDGMIEFFCMLAHFLIILLIFEKETLKSPTITEIGKCFPLVLSVFTTVLFHAYTFRVDMPS